MVAKMLWTAACVALAFGAAQAQVPELGVTDFTAAVKDFVVSEPSSSAGEIKVLFTDVHFAVEGALEWTQNETGTTTASNEIQWALFVDGTQVDSGTEAIPASRQLITTFPAGGAMVSTNGAHEIKLVVTVNGVETETSKSLQAISSGVSLFPLIVILFMAMFTRMVELSLGFGVFVGACIVAGSVTDGFKATLDNYILKALADEGHGFVILFTIFLSGVVAMMEKSGGIQGLTKALTRFATSPRSGQAVAFGSGLLIFFDDYANCLVIGATMLPVLDRLSVSREKLAFVVDATAAPIASLVPLSSWVGYEAGLIGTELEKIAEANGGEVPSGLKPTGFGVFLASIAYRYYPIFLLFFQVLLIAGNRDFGPMLISERLCQVYGRTDGGRGALKSVKSLADANSPEPDTPQRWWNMIGPVIILIGYIFGLLVKSGESGDEGQTFIDKIENSDSYAALLYGTMAAAITTMLFYMFQYKRDGNIVPPNPNSLCKSDEQIAKSNLAIPLLTIRQGLDSFLFGFTRVFPAIVVLVLAWACGSIMGDVGASRLFAIWITNSANVNMLPTISFFISVLLALCTGTSWGTMAIVFPLLLVPTWTAASEQLGEEDAVVIFYSVVAGVLSGAVAGDHCSPISDTTVLSSLATSCDLLAHVQTQAPYVVVVVIWSMLVGTIPVGMLSYSTGVAILMGFIVMFIMVVILAVKVIHPTGRYDVFTELYLLVTKNNFLLDLKRDTATCAEQGSPIQAQGDATGGAQVADETSGQADAGSEFEFAKVVEKGEESSMSRV